MLSSVRHSRAPLVSLAGAFLVLAVVMAGCAGQAAPDKIATTASAKQPAADTIASKGGAQLWGENCSRCHNTRDPSSHNATEWQTIMMHMRVRASLTAEEHKKILDFLIASSK
jgi:cytochrome c5